MQHSDINLRWHSCAVQIVSSTVIATLSSTVLARFNDQPVTALCAEVRPDPLDEDAEAQAVLGQKLYVDQGPDEPCKETAHQDTAALQDRKILADYGKVAFVEVTKRGKRGFLSHLPKD